MTFFIDMELLKTNSKTYNNHKKYFLFGLRHFKMWYILDTFFKFYSGHTFQEPLTKILRINPDTFCKGLFLKPHLYPLLVSNDGHMTGFILALFWAWLPHFLENFGHTFQVSTHLFKFWTHLFMFWTHLLKLYLTSCIYLLLSSFLNPCRLFSRPFTTINWKPFSSFGTHFSSCWDTFLKFLNTFFKFGTHISKFQCTFSSLGHTFSSCIDLLLSAKAKLY